MIVNIPTRSVHIGGRRTSMRLLPELWALIQTRAQREGRYPDDVIADLAAGRGDGTAIRAVERGMLLWAAELAGLTPLAVTPMRRGRRPRAVPPQADTTAPTGA